MSLHWAAYVLCQDKHKWALLSAACRMRHAHKGKWCARQAADVSALLLAILEIDLQCIVDQLTFLRGLIRDNRQVGLAPAACGAAGCLCVSLSTNYANNWQSTLTRPATATAGARDALMYAQLDEQISSSCSRSCLP